MDIKDLNGSLELDTKNLTDGIIDQITGGKITPKTCDVLTFQEKATGDMTDFIRIDRAIELITDKLFTPYDPKEYRRALEDVIELLEERKGLVNGIERHH